MQFFIDRIKGLSGAGIAGLIVVFAVVGVVLFITGARYINTAPAQCASCHPVITDMWKSSLNHPAEQVTCHECHAGHPELKASPNVLAFIRDTFIPEKYMATTERTEERCTECHNNIASSEKELSKLIKINHKAHLAAPIEQSGLEVNLGCVDCHFNIAHDKAEEQTNRPPMYSCFVSECHQKERNRDRCQKCHYQMLTDSGKIL